jgi:hypothetical protein
MFNRISRALRGHQKDHSAAAAAAQRRQPSTSASFHGLDLSRSASRESVDPQPRAVGIDRDIHGRGANSGFSPGAAHRLEFTAGGVVVSHDIAGMAKPFHPEHEAKGYEELVSWGPTYKDEIPQIKAETGVDFEKAFMHAKQLFENLNGADAEQLKAANLAMRGLRKAIPILKKNGMDMSPSIQQEYYSFYPILQEANSDAVAYKSPDESSAKATRKISNPASVAVKLQKASSDAVAYKSTGESSAKATRKISNSTSVDTEELIPIDKGTAQKIFNGALVRARQIIATSNGIDKNEIIAANEAMRDLRKSVAYLKRYGIEMQPHVREEYDQLCSQVQKTTSRESAKKLSATQPNDDLKDTEQGLSAFVELADKVQNHKIRLFDRVRPSEFNAAARLETAFACANIVHGKAGHNENVVRACEIFLEKRALTDNMRDILTAAQWHGLADRDIPVAVLAAKRPKTDAEKKDYIDSRSSRSAELYGEYFGENKMVQMLIHQTGMVGEESRNRPQAAQLLDLMDRVCAKGIDLDYVKGDLVDDKEMFKAIEAELEEDDIYIDPMLFREVKYAVKHGLLEEALQIKRRESTDVRSTNAAPASVAAQQPQPQLPEQQQQQEPQPLPAPVPKQRAATTLRRAALT